MEDGLAEETFREYRSLLTHARTRERERARKKMSNVSSDIHIRLFSNGLGRIRIDRRMNQTKYYSDLRVDFFDSSYLNIDLASYGVDFNHGI